ncbi:MAG: hypothetical protein J07HQW2_00680 [Haloquadratum walsbyi J07HQW2]|jgi:hypothetical protein|uniref:Uncharacterized protein n=1 Tax=Haloquadratum walsbyi J07HQW2 TaxID=1238425 RepID=U1PPL0_9EURY|nr:MAG: hypothetical protein J07HQW2_00680 [Haloquadratum walsbyi J07HQW2]
MRPLSTVTESQVCTCINKFPVSVKMPDIEKQPETWLVGMDGVLMHDDTALPEAEDFIHQLREQKTSVPRTN